MFKRSGLYDTCFLQMLLLLLSCFVMTYIIVTIICTLVTAMMQFIMGEITYSETAFIHEMFHVPCYEKFNYYL